VLEGLSFNVSVEANMPEKFLLILDDDEAIGQTIGLIAESFGVASRHTTSHRQFFELLDQLQPSHIALDLVMPDMDGVQVLAHLAERQCRSQVIILSGMGGRVLAAAQRSAHEHGITIAGVIGKPFLPSALRDLLVDQPAPQVAAAVLPQDPKPSGAPAKAQITLDELKQGLLRKQLCVYYQPKLHCASTTLAGFEALVRWRHPQRGLVPPDQFVPLAEAHGMIDDVTQQVLDESLGWFSAWTNRPSSDDSPNRQATLSINMSAKTLRSAQFVDRIVDHCRQLHLEPARITFELTETSAMEDPTASLDLLTRMRMKGFQLSIDDFGTGYSSMLQLVRLPFTEIKIDKSFVMTASSSAESLAVIKSIVDLGHSLDMKSAAEGVEDRKTLDYLKSIGCDLAQGYLFARPMPAAALEDWVASQAKAAPPMPAP
jgi:EAL domain-containing protein (putative c-di-GMP-specific phosphodiesterase class I)/DNA-binding NarL/FixJ family response regulator